MSRSPDLVWPRSPGSPTWRSNRLPEGIEPGLEATRFYDPIRGAFAAGRAAAAVEVDRATGASCASCDYVCVEDAGRVIHPQIVDGQIAGAIAQGLGGALYEHLVYDEAATCPPAPCWTT